MMLEIASYERHTYGIRCMHVHVLYLLPYRAACQDPDAS